MNQPTESPSPSPLRKSLTMESINAALWDTTMLQKVQILTQSCRTLIAELTALRLAVAQQQEEDTRMLDWLEANKTKLFGLYYEAIQKWVVVSELVDGYTGGIVLGDGPTLRAAIASAMSKETL